MMGFRDVHSHVIYGVDDGAKTREIMETMLDIAHEEGIVKIYSTPHVTPGLQEFDWDKYHRHVEMAKEYCKKQGYPMTLLTGAEILYTPAIKRYAEERLLPTIGETNYILMEFVPDVAFDELKRAVDLMERCGYDLILAHIERYRCMYHGNAYRVKDKHEVWYQMNASTVTESRGFLKDREVRKWLKDGLIDYVGTDAHNTSSRAPRIREAYEVLKEQYGIQYAAKLTGMPIRRKQG